MIFSTGFKLIYVNHRNTAILARWLDAKYCVSKYRPVPIEEYLVYENVAYSAFTSNHLLTEASHLALEASSQILRKPRPLRNIQTFTVLGTKKSCYKFGRSSCERDCQRRFWCSHILQ